MASRKKTDLVNILKESFEYGVKRWEELYPLLPKPFLTATFRNYAEQNQLYSQGRTTKGVVVTNAKGGESPHNFHPSFAYDIAFKMENGKLDWSPHLFDKFAAIIKEKYDQYITWGGDFRTIKDKPHFEYKKWKDEKVI